MIASRLEVTADTRPHDHPAKPRLYVPTAALSEGTFSTSSVHLQLAAGAPTTLPASAFFALAAKLVGCPAREWETVAESLGVFLQGEMPEGTLEQNAAKALFMIATWLEPVLVRGDPSVLSAQLLDELVVDYTGAPGSQRYLYFPGEPVQRAASSLLERLFELHLLVKTRITIGSEHIDRVLVPLVTPGVLTARFDSGMPPGMSAARLWRAIRGDLGARVARLVERPQGTP